ncbi:MAG: hypothetical protein ACI8WT_001421 [Clostridium sp.]|jgi:hypothetical protein
MSFRCFFVENIWNHKLNNREIATNGTLTQRSIVLIILVILDKKYFVKTLGKIFFVKYHCKYKEYRRYSKKVQNL